MKKIICIEEHKERAKQLDMNKLDRLPEDIIRYITDAAKSFESRINVLGVDVRDEPDRNGINVNIVFSIINNPEPMSFSIFLKRVR